jgi:lysozyme
MIKQDLKIRLRADLIRDEGFELKPYRCTAGKLTIGCGRNLEDRGITPDEAFFLFDTDYKLVLLHAQEIFGPSFDNWSENRQLAVLNMLFNLGYSRFIKFRRMVSAMKKCEWRAAAAEAMISKWAIQVGDRAKRLAKMIEEG